LAATDGVNSWMVAANCRRTAWSLRLGVQQVTGARSLHFVLVHCYCQRSASLLAVEWIPVGLIVHLSDWSAKRHMHIPSRVWSFGDISARFSSFKKCIRLADLQQIDVT